MAYIDYIPYEDASEDLRELYRKYGGKNQTPANIVRIAGPNPKALDAHVRFYRAIMFDNSPLSRDQREMIAVVVSGINHCHYWIEHHWTALRSLGNVEDSLKEKLVSDYMSADLSQHDKFILSYADKLTRQPSSITREYLDGLRAVGFDDRSLHDIVQVTAYFNYVNRLADGLGVELE